MRQRLKVALDQWVEWRANLRRWPWLDCIPGGVIFACGLAALLDWRAFVFESRFYELRHLICPLGMLSIATGIGQVISGIFRSQIARQISSSFGVFVMAVFAWNVETLDGHIGWGGWTFLEILICAAVLV